MKPASRKKAVRASMQIIGPRIGPTARGVSAPVEAELKGEHNAGHDPEPEADREDLAPEPEHLKVERITGLVVAAVADDQEDRQADRQRREGHVERRRRRELPARQIDEGL